MTAVRAVQNEPAASTEVADQGRAFQASLDFFLGPVRQFFRDPSVSEIMVNGPASIYIEQAGRLHRVDAAFQSEHDLRAAANNIAQFLGQHLGPDRPVLDGRLPDGSRVCIVLAPIATAGTSITIRRFARAAVAPDFLLERRAVTPEAMEFLLLAVAARVNLIISGGTGSGKTTLLNVLSTAFADDERIVTIEDTRELQVQKEHVVYLQSRPADAFGRGEISIRDLFVTSLRMRPDRIVVGEVRRGEAIDMIQAMTSGHRGSLATLHASSPADACHRLETMALMADVGLPLSAVRRQIASAVDLVVQGTRLHGGRRLISRISEVDYDESQGAYIIEDLFALHGEHEDDLKLRWTGRRPRLAGEIAVAGLADKVKHTRTMLAEKRA